ncbi:lipoate--protein ligase [Clostridia bacterium OttesenSCG-928-F22]|nr:lipoate--protein ligase [Clostridia bacterium OttesenSCG-928-F22]
MYALVLGKSFDPYYNLAVEELLLKEYGAEVLYLWQNEKTVVIGRNQNAWRECHIERLQAAGGKLARRITGGGAVFHDLGNLNFSFIGKERAGRVEEQLEFIISALAELGVKAQFSGRNDIILADGRKFSGNAFSVHGGRSLHHGTIMVDVNVGGMQYLRVDHSKLQSHAVASVYSRIANLREVSQGITVEAVSSILSTRYREKYGTIEAEPHTLLSEKSIRRLTERNASWQWNMGRTPTFDITLEHRFDWGLLQLCLSLRDGHIHDAAVYSDGLDANWLLSLGAVQKGLRFDRAAMAQAVHTLEHHDALQHRMAEEIADWLMEVEY